MVPEGPQMDRHEEVSAPEAASFLFVPLGEDHLTLVHEWLNRPAVNRWWDKRVMSFDVVAEEYRAMIDGTDPTRGFIAQLDGQPIGYVQTYRICDHPDYHRAVAVDVDAAGLDIFIGEDEARHQGLGCRIITQFLREVVFGTMPCTHCIIGPEPRNRSAIRAYGKAGFRYLKTIQVPGEPEPEYLMWIERSAVMGRATDDAQGEP